MARVPDLIVPLVTAEAPAQAVIDGAAIRGLLAGEHRLDAGLAEQSSRLHGDREPSQVLDRAAQAPAGYAIAQVDWPRVLERAVGGSHVPASAVRGDRLEVGPPRGVHPRGAKDPFRHVIVV